jgi:hypothetical protein
MTAFNLSLRDSILAQVRAGMPASEMVLAVDRQIRDAGFANCHQRHPPRAHPGEQAAVDEVLRIVQQRTGAMYPAGTAARRDAHPKHHGVFFVRDAKNYLEFFRIVMRDTLPTRFFIGPNPFKWRRLEMKNAKNTRTRIANPLDVQYWSTVPTLMPRTCRTPPGTACPSTGRWAA